ncbi:hypothetical protein [Legionella birminghamensis]|nr:hypothetical protein [Legionella birminghamensis]
MPQDKFSYLLDDNDTPRKLSDLEILGLKPDFFKQNNRKGQPKDQSHQFALYAKKYRVKYHPDHNDNSPRSNEASKLIGAAIDRIAANLRRNNGEYKEKDKSNEGFVPDVNLDDFLQERLQACESAQVVMNVLEKEINNLGTPDENLTIPDIARLFAKNAILSRVTPELISFELELFDKLSKKAKTADDLFAIAMVHKQLDSGLLAQWVDVYRHFIKPAEMGHISALRQVASYMMFGQFDDYPSSSEPSYGFMWALDCLYTFQQTIIPALEASNNPQDQEQAKLLKDDIARTIRRFGMTEVPAKGSKEYERILQYLKNKNPGYKEDMEKNLPFGSASEIIREKNPRVWQLMQPKAIESAKDVELQKEARSTAPFSETAPPSSDQPAPKKQTEPEPGHVVNPKKPDVQVQQTAAQDVHREQQNSFEQPGKADIFDRLLKKLTEIDTQASMQLPLHRVVVELEKASKFSSPDYDTLIAAAEKTVDLLEKPTKQKAEDYVEYANSLQQSSGWRRLGAAMKALGTLIARWLVAAATFGRAKDTMQSLSTTAKESWQQAKTGREGLSHAMRLFGDSKKAMKDAVSDEKAADEVPGSPANSPSSSS